jgi:hypothetical protein
MINYELAKSCYNEILYSEAEERVKLDYNMPRNNKTARITLFFAKDVRL